MLLFILATLFFYPKSPLLKCALYGVAQKSADYMFLESPQQELALL